MQPINVKLEAFEGPLDLLLHLIDKNQIDIYDIPIARLTDQYMAYIDAFSSRNMEQLSEFLVMAATLLEIKSKMLLPPVQKDEEKTPDPREALVDRLVEYKRFRDILPVLLEKHVLAQRYITRNPECVVIDMLKSPKPPDFDDLLEGLTTQKLFAVFDETLRRRALKIDVVHSEFKSITKEIYTVEGKMTHMEKLLFLHKKIKFEDLFGACASKHEIIVTFLALLELAKLKKIKIRQCALFEAIEIVAY